MKKSLATIFLFFLLILSFPQKKDASFINYYTTYKKAEKIFERAEQLSDKADIDSKIQLFQDKLYNEALDTFSMLAKIIDRVGIDSLRFYVTIKIGLIDHYFNRLKEAKENYLESIRLKPKFPGIEDSFLFKPFLFLGGILYDSHQFDSASMYYQKAELIQNKYKVVLEESQRLYNRLGAMNYETGNYRLAKTYFEKALSTLVPSKASYVSLMINYKINIASILVKLEQFDEAKIIYESILPYKIYENEIWHNLGIINTHLGKPAEAIGYLKKIKYSDNNNRSVDLNYNLALAFDSLGKRDSVEKYLQSASLENGKFNGGQKNTAYGLVSKFLGDMDTADGKFEEALKYYQRAIVQFDISFNDEDIHKNPNQYSGIFSYIHLFNTLVAKADCFEKLNNTHKELRSLQTALDAYKSAFKLVDYVEKTYESDESRLFLNGVKYASHSKPIDLCLYLYELTKERKYLEEAYRFDQRNKASILTLNLQLPQIQKQAGIASEIIEKQSSLKSAITRLSMKASQLVDSIQLRHARDQISDLEIQLGALQQGLNNNPKYSQLQLADQIPTVSELQNKILDNNTALISYHISEQELLILVVTTKGFGFYKHGIGDKFYKNISSFLKSLHNVDDAEKFNGDSASKYMYSYLIDPILPEIKDCNRLIIIPDDELSYLPFESLKNEGDQYLIESFSVQYQYSTALLQVHGGNNHTQKNNILAFAPFTEQNPHSDLEILKYSKDEVERLNGKIFTGKDATKNNFLSTADHYGIIHLATHANTNDQSPLKSFISFYPAGSDSSDRLYAQEIYDLRLDSVQLIILSACETGAGQLVRGEGLMSLSRAFAYAGCTNIITSLWKAEDRTTAFITKRLHVYLQKNYSMDKALRQAKIDLLNSNEIEPRFKTPNYWAHLVFIGSYHKAGSSLLNYLWIALGAMVFICLVFITKKGPRHKQDPDYS